MKAAPAWESWSYWNQHTSVAFYETSKRIMLSIEKYYASFKGKWRRVSNGSQIPRNWRISSTGKHKRVVTLTVFPPGHVLLLKDTVAWWRRFESFRTFMSFHLCDLILCRYLAGWSPLRDCTLSYNTHINTVPREHRIRQGKEPRGLADLINPC